MLRIEQAFPGLPLPATIACRARLAGALARTLGSVFATVRLWHRRHTTRHALAEVDDRTLADIGLTRAEARRESARPFWSI